MKKTIELKFLGTSSSEAIPRQGDDCPQCLSKDRKDQRLRSSLLVNGRILVDAGPDVLKQLATSQIRNLDSVVITHEHEDHIGGLKYLSRIRQDMPIFRTKPGQHFKLLGVDFFAFKVLHSKMAVTVGLIIDNETAYIPDSASLDLALKYLRESRMAILDGSVLGRSFGGHLSINDIVAITKPFENLRKIYFTHNGHTKKPHREMINLVRSIGDERFSLAYDGLSLKL